MRRSIALFLAGTLSLTLLATVPGRASTVGMGDCGWFTRADPDRINIAFPDESAQYWLANYVLPPGVEMHIVGEFPRGRYLSFHAYEGSVPIDGISDFALTATTGTNPFVLGAPRDGGGTYDLRVVGGPRQADADREPNTLYAGEGLNGEPVVTGTLIYRLYLPEGDIQGSVPLPSIEYRTAGGEDTIELPGDCTIGRAGGDGTLNDAIVGASLPVASPNRPAQPPSWGVARSRPEANAVGPATVYTGNVFFANFDNQYLSLLVGRTAGDVLVIRAKPPTFADTRGTSTMPDAQLRYWSFCSNDLPTTRYIGCLADEQAKVGADGLVTVVISDPDHRPTLNATDNWLPAGPYADFFVLDRHMLPAPDFTGAIQNVPDKDHIAQSMGAYYPVPTVCSTAQFNATRCA